MGTSWTQIHTAYVRSGRINERRTQMDLKDKWRNLVRLVTHPGRHSRGAELSNDQRQLILGIVFRPPDAGGDPPASSPGARLPVWAAICEGVAARDWARFIPPGMLGGVPRVLLESVL